MRITRDYATPTKRTPGKRRKSASAGTRPAKATPGRKVSSGFAWVSGFVSGAVSIGLVWFLLSPGARLPGGAPSAPPAGPPVAGADTTNDPRPAALTFYDALQTRKVWVPVVDEYGSAEPPPQAAPDGGTAGADSSEPTLRAWQLQAGSFRQITDANVLRARLLLAGHQAEIQSVTLNEGGVWHRVMVGPYPNHRAMRRALSALRKAQIDAIPMELRGSAATPPT